jgi:hypothetical protein
MSIDFIISSQLFNRRIRRSALLMLDRRERPLPKASQLASMSLYPLRSIHACWSIESRSSVFEVQHSCRGEAISFPRSDDPGVALWLAVNADLASHPCADEILAKGFLEPCDGKVPGAVRGRDFLDSQPSKIGHDAVNL